MDPRRLAAVLQTTRIIHAAMMFSVVLYGVVLWQVSKQPHGAHDVPAPVMQQYIVFVFTAVVGGALAVLGTQQLGRARQGDPHRIAARMMTPMILRLAGAEAIALGGFAATFLSRMTNFVPYLIGAPIAIAAMASFFPRASMFQSADASPPPFG